MPDPDLNLVLTTVQRMQVELREMKFAAEIERANNRSSYDALVHQVGTAFGVFQGVINERLDAMDARLAVMDAKLDQILARPT